MQGSTFSVEIPNLPKIQAMLADYPSVSIPIIQKAIIASQAILAKFTTAATVPVRTGYLMQNWAFESGDLQARWYPRASYAPYVEFGTGPHEILPKNAQALSWPGAAHPVKRVKHPGTKANPFMERIVTAAQPEIEALFVEALDQVTAAITSSSNG